LVVESCPAIGEVWVALATLQPGGSWTANASGVGVVESDLGDRRGVVLTKSSANSFEMVRITLAIEPS